MKWDDAMEKKITIIGAAVLDIFAGPVDKEIFTRVSVPAGNIGMSCGGDALNEAVFLSRLGGDVELITLLGDDEAAKTIHKCIEENRILSDKVTISRDVPTAMNIVLVDDEGERYFVTNPESSLRKLSKEHILPYVEEMGDIVGFASIFVSSALSVTDMEEVFSAIKKKEDRVLVADMTTAKRGETVKDLLPILRYVDYIVPNQREAEILTGESDPEKSARAFIDNGAKCVIIKCGKNGCFYMDETHSGMVAAYPARAVDTTGAGDSFVSGFIYGLSKGMSLEDCCRYGCAVASIVVEAMGAQTAEITPEEVDRRLGGCYFFTKMFSTEAGQG
jgi:sugar/nucleoside kinase (ribokinase family)